MPVSQGKQFESILKTDFSSLPGSFIYRLPDQMTGYRVTSRNPSDFIGFVSPNCFLLEAKSITGNTFPLTNLTQFEILNSYENIPGLRRGVVIWFRDHKRVIYVPISTIKTMKEDNKKSVNIRTIETDGYNYVEIPTVTKRVFPKSDYSVLLNLPDNW